ncbi:hypothetical protein TELCIR_17778 [Teladorsagia circumcincta]|uniref:Uncharacterized protein n=1 Tax=Teladorsagia circumcincta TaxID=45464 RepID=A0A2G9TS46_TELCI|nr:hypothetical protein TELCIR_17778 [Teladorsagia circumcincta]
MWDEEKEHLDIMERLAAKHEVPLTVFTPIFSLAAYALGTKWALSDKSRLLEKWSHYLTGMGIARRTKAQIEEKLRNEVKKIHRYMKAENGTGRCDRYRLPSYLDPLVRIMTKNLSAEGTAEKGKLFSSHPKAFFAIHFI